MTHLIATTETGTTYELNGSRVQILEALSGPRWQSGSTFTLYSSQVAEETPELKKPWAYNDGEENPWEDSWVPVIGKRWYVSGKDEWRVSTPIVSIEEIKEEE
jgi:hypothetical protein